MSYNGIFLEDVHNGLDARGIAAAELEIMQGQGHTIRYNKSSHRVEHKTRVHNRKRYSRRRRGESDSRRGFKAF